MQRYVVYVVIGLVAASWVPLALIARARALRSSKPRVHIFQGMDEQAKYKDQATNALFKDRRSMRPRIPGTVARGALRDDDHYYRGQVQVDGKGQWAPRFPDQVEVTEALVLRGKERFEIACATCHGLGGDGDGPVAVRAEKLDAAQWGWIPPLSLHSDTVRERTVGFLYNVITNGIRTMPAYGPQVTVADRWAIVAYLRALQFSRRASIEDVPVEERDTLR